MRNDILYESVKKFVKTRKEDLNAYFTASLRICKFIISRYVNFFFHRNLSVVGEEQRPLSRKRLK